MKKQKIKGNKKGKAQIFNFEYIDCGDSENSQIYKISKRLMDYNKIVNCKILETIL